MPQSIRVNYTKSKMSSELPSIFNKSLPCWNMAIVGDENTNKSKLVQEMIIQEFLDTDKHKLRPKAVVFCSSQANNYNRLIKSLGGSEILIDGNYFYNPFDIYFCKEVIPNKLKMEHIISQLKIPENFQEKAKQSLNSFYTQIYSGSFDDKQMRQAILSFFEEDFKEFLGFASINDLYSILRLNSGEYKPTGENKEYILKVILEILEIYHSDPKSNIKDQIEHIIDSLYEQNQSPNLLSFQKELENKGLNNLALKVEEFLKNKTEVGFNQFFIQTKDVSVVSYINQFSKSQRKNYQLVLDKYFNMIMDSYHGFKMKVYDGADWYDNQAELYVVVNNLRTARKRFMGIILVTENIRDFSQFDENAGQAIMSNMSHNIITGFNKPDSLYEAAKNLNITVEELIGLGFSRKFDKKTNTILQESLKFLYLKD